MRKKPLLSFSMFFFLLLFTSSLMEVMKAQNSTVSVKVGVIIDMDYLKAKVWLSCLNMAISDFYAFHSHYKTRVVFQIRNSKNDVISAASAALDLIKNEQVQAIIGPRTSMQADFIIKLGEKSQVPIISYSATSPSLTSIRSPYFFRATQNDSTQVEAISAITNFFGWREAVPIYVDNKYGQGVIPYLTDALQAIDTRIPYRSVISPTASDDQIMKELYKLMTMQTRVFIVHMSSSIGSKFFSKVREVGMMSKGYVWIITDGFSDLLSSLAPSVMDSMQGVLGIKPYIPRTKKLETFQVRWKRKFLQDNPQMVDAEMDLYGLWAYDVGTALAMEIEEAGTQNLSFRKPNSPANDLLASGVSQNGQNLVQALSNTRFNGLTGDFLFVNGQLPSSAFEIVNVIGSETKIIGFWTPENGLVRNLMSRGENIKILSSTPKSSLQVTWPGKSDSVPKGWEIPTNGKKLQIGVPMKVGFSEFVKVSRDPNTKIYTVIGYSIDIFKAALEALPYSLMYDFIPFAYENGTMKGTYNDMIDQVYLGKFDVVVGDTTIIANRSIFVDFTMPYTESGVSMIVPIRDNKSKNAWVFLKPLTWDLWVTSFCFFVFIGFVTWVLEHRINEDFRGPPSHQAGTSFWFSFSTMVFTQREKVVSNLARTVIIIWCFVVLILTQIYTASLTSLLTVQQLLPIVTDVKQLIENEEYVGYQDGSFVFGILKRLGFDESKLRAYTSYEEIDQLFSKGSGNGGVAAVFDEVPYMKLFVAKYCSKYTMIEPTFKTGGFGFVFPKGSPLVPDISRKILDVTERDEMKDTERKWLGDPICSDSSTSISSNSISLQSFWGLFLIAGMASALALIIFATIFIYEHRNILMAEGSIKSRILYMFRMFNEKDLESHTFKKRESNVPPLASSNISSLSVYSDSHAFVEFTSPVSPMEIVNPNQEC